jgi:hypothetical protein
MMQKWEYLIVIVEGVTIKGRGYQDIVTFDGRRSTGKIGHDEWWEGETDNIWNILDKLGEQGWELVSVKKHGGYTQGYYFFKRPKE